MIFLKTIIWCNSVKILRASWQTGASVLPRRDHSFAVGSYNHSVFILGGRLNSNQIVEYKILTDTFNDIGVNNSLNIDLYGAGQFWTQHQDDIIYVIKPMNTMISIYSFNMSDKTYRANEESTFPIGSMDNTCLASSDEFLYITGGEDINNVVFQNTLITFSLSTMDWMTNNPSMQTARASHPCIVSNGFLWVFSGENSEHYWAETNERINISNIHDNSWDFTQSLYEPAKGMRSVAWNEYIYIMGGMKYNNAYLTTVYIVNSNTGSVTLSGDSLQYTIRYQGAILVGSIIYSFGGQGPTDKWMYNQMPTMSPTPNPSTAPTDRTEHPSASPTAFISTKEDPTSSYSISETLFANVSRTYNNSILATAANSTTDSTTTHHAAFETSLESYSSTIDTMSATETATHDHTFVTTMSTNTSILSTETILSTKSGTVALNVSYMTSTILEASSLLDNKGVLIYITIGVSFFAFVVLLLFYYVYSKQQDLLTEQQEIIENMDANVPKRANDKRANDKIQNERREGEGRIDALEVGERDHAYSNGSDHANDDLCRNNPNAETTRNHTAETKNQKTEGDIANV